MSFVEAARTADIADGRMAAVEIEGKPILIINYQGNFYAVDGKCPHQGGQLGKGRLEGNVVTCPRHGAQFDVTSGRNVSGPKIGPFKGSTKNINVYEVKVENGSIMVNVP